MHNLIFFFKQKTAYEIRNCDWSSDVCSSDLYDWAPALPNIAEVLCPVFASNTDVTIAAMHLVTRMMMMSFMRYESLVFPTTNLLGK